MIFFGHVELSTGPTETKSKTFFVKVWFLGGGLKTAKKAYEPTRYRYLKVRNKDPPKSKINSFKKVRGGVLFEFFKNVSRMLFSTQGSWSKRIKNFLKKIFQKVRGGSYFVP